MSNPKHKQTLSVVKKEVTNTDDNTEKNNNDVVIKNNLDEIISLTEQQNKALGKILKATKKMSHNK